MSAAGAGRPPHLVRTLVRLKVRLILNRARRSPGGWVLLGMAGLAAVLTGAAAGLALAALGRSGHEGLARAALVIGADVLTLGWALLPLLTFGTDETLDPGRLALLPLRPSALVRGLLAASFVGPAPAVALLATAGAVVGYAGGGGWLVVPAAGLALVLSATAARTLSTVLAARLASRRGRDLTIVVVSTLALAAQGVRFVRVSVDADRLADIGRWLPPGMLGQAVVDARAGHLGPALAQLVPAALAVPLLLWVWARALERSLTVVAEGESPRARHRARAPLPLLVRWLPLGTAPWAAVAARELRYLAREPRRKVVVVNSLLLGLFATLWPALSSGRDQRTVLMATAASYLAMLNSSNQLGFDGGARWMDVVAGDTSRTVLAGKNAATAVHVLAAVAAIGVIAAAVTGGWAYLPVAVAVGLAGLGAGLGLGNVISVRLPVRLPPGDNPFASRGGGQGCGTSLLLVAGALVQNLLLLPVAGGVALAVVIDARLLAVVVPLTLAYAGGLWWAGLISAARWASSHEPEILTAVDPARGG